MQIIVAKNASYMRRSAPYLALCEVTRQTDRRYYVTLLRGDRGALDGPHDNAYVSVDAVLSLDATRYDAMVAACAAFDARRAELNQMEDEAWGVLEAALMIPAR